MSGPGYRENMHRAESMAANADRIPLYRLIDRKLSGQKRRDALAFVRGRRTGRDLERLAERIEGLPDVARDGHVNARLTSAQVAGIRTARAEGATFAAIAGRFDVSAATAYSICAGKRWAQSTEGEATDDDRDRP